MRKPRSQRQRAIMGGNTAEYGEDLGAWNGWPDTEGPRGVADVIAHAVPETINRQLSANPFDIELVVGDEFEAIPRNPDLWSENDERCLLLYGELDGHESSRWYGHVSKLAGFGDPFRWLWRK